jgi:hypothetical protein
MMSVHVGAQVCLLPSAPGRKSLSSRTGRFIPGEELPVLLEQWAGWAPDRWGKNKRDCAISYPVARYRG